MGMRIESRAAGDFRDVTCHLNPSRCEHRLHNCRLFCERLVVARFCVNISRDGEYEREQSDSETPIKIHAPHVMICWHD